MDWYSSPKLTGQEATAQDGGNRQLYPVKVLPLPIKEETGWALETVWTVLRKGKPHVPGEIRNPDRPACS